MLWKTGRRSQNVEDRRGDAASGRLGGGFPGGFGRGGPGGMGSRLPVGGRTGGIGCLGLVAIIVLMLVFGLDPSMLLQTGSPPYAPGQAPVTAPSATVGRTPSQQELTEFVSVVLADTEDTWHQVFREVGGAYVEPTLVLFSGSVRSACGLAGTATGPFYCPRDRKVYLDLDFFEELQRRFQAPGDFAQAYVIAHEVGHHVQNLLGILPKVQQLQQQVSDQEAKQLQVMVELQADCFSGVWAHRAQKARQILEAGDIDEAMNAAAAVGDDRIQKQTQGYVVPDAFTHGSSAQRAHWFRRGLETGDLRACDTFSAERF